MISTYSEELDALPTASTNSSLDDIRAHFAGVDDALNRAEKTIEGIAVPDDLSIAHPAFADSITRFSDLAERVARRADGMQTQDDVFDLANDSELGVNNFHLVEAQMVAACLEIQATADRLEAEVDLGCRTLAGL